MRESLTESYDKWVKCSEYGRLIHEIDLIGGNPEGQRFHQPAHKIVNSVFGEMLAEPFIGVIRAKDFRNKIGDILGASHHSASYGAITPLPVCTVEYGLSIGVSFDPNCVEQQIVHFDWHIANLRINILKCKHISFIIL